MLLLALLMILPLEVISSEKFYIVISKKEKNDSTNLSDHGKINDNYSDALFGVYYPETKMLALHFNICLSCASILVYSNNVLLKSSACMSKPGDIHYIKLLSCIAGKYDIRIIGDMDEEYVSKLII